MPKSQLSLRIPEVELKILNRHSEKKHRTKTDLVREFIRSLDKSRAKKTVAEEPPTTEGVIQNLHELGKQARHILKHTELDKTKKRSLVDSENYETELVQVAATAVAALTDYWMQRSDHQQTIIEQQIWEDILTERKRQAKQFNESMPVGLDPYAWGLVLIEETAEVMAEVKEGGDRHD